MPEKILSPKGSMQSLNIAKQGCSTLAPLKVMCSDQQGRGSFNLTRIAFFVVNQLLIEERERVKELLQSGQSS